MKIEIGDFEDWMKPQVAQLFSMQYGVNSKDFAELMTDFYEHPYQQEKCIRVVAKEGNKIAGFQSFFYWPYSYEGKEYCSYQSGNSLVHPDYRGKGIFQKLLNAIEEKRSKYGIDFLVGFPVEDSYKSFIRNGWTNVLDMKWYIKIVNPIAGIFSPDKRRLKKIFPDEKSQLHEQLPLGSFRLTSDAEFSEWRKNYSKNEYFIFNYEEKNEFVRFELKYNRRKRMINELIVGNIVSSTEDNLMVERGLRALSRKAFASFVISIISIAINKLSLNSLSPSLYSSGFKESKKKIFFIVKSFNESLPVMDSGKWDLFRSDIDTW